MIPSETIRERRCASSVSTGSETAIVSPNEDLGHNRVHERKPR